MATKTMSIMCSECSGSKVTKKVEWVDCPSCQGKGCIDNGIVIGTCGHCKGLGRILKTVWAPCNTCHGNGALGI